MLTVDEVAGRIRTQLKGKEQHEVIDANTGLEDLGLSSLDVAEIVFSIEEDHGVEFDTAKAADVKTLGQLVDLANEAISQQVAA
jgi:acyl carrier protein